MTVRIIHILLIAVTFSLISRSVKKAENPNIIFILTAKITKERTSNVKLL